MKPVARTRPTATVVSRRALLAWLVVILGVLYICGVVVIGVELHSATGQPFPINNR